MSQSVVPASVSAPEARIPPLTRNRYERHPATTRQIAAALDLSSSGLVARAKITDESDPHWLGAEALVFFLRRANQAADKATCAALFRILASRCVVFFRGKIRGFAPHDREDIQQEVFSRLIEAILSEDDRGDFAQVRFWNFLDRRTTTEIAKARQRSTITVSLDDPLSAAEDEEAKTPHDVEDKQLNPEALAVLSEGLARLDPRLRQVFLMRHALGMAVGKENRADEDPADPSIASHFNVSARSIGKWLAKAEAQLAPYRKASL